MNEQQIAKKVQVTAECRERLAKTWEAAARRYFSLAETMTPGSFAHGKVSSHAVECQAFADELRDTYPNVKKFYHAVAGIERGGAS